jgi:hypothetical protein
MTKSPTEFEWTGPRADRAALSTFGVRLEGGGPHQSKTMMFAELDALLSTGLDEAAELELAAIAENVLGKATANTRSLTYRHLAALYGLKAQPSLTKALFAIWRRDPQGHRLQALLVALARDPLLRSTAMTILESPVGSTIKWPAFAAALEEVYPNRFREKTLRSLAQNCASSWTQSGHLQGALRKIRQRVWPTPPVAAFAALLAAVSGFTGPAVLSSIWMKVLDLSPDRALELLRQAEAIGLARVRSAGDVTEISIRQPMAAALGVRELEHV